MKKKTYKQIDEHGNVHQTSEWLATPENDWLKIMAENKQRKELYEKYLYFTALKEKLEKEGYSPQKVQEILREEINHNE